MDIITLLSMATFNLSSQTHFPYPWQWMEWCWRTSWLYSGLMLGCKLTFSWLGANIIHICVGMQGEKNAGFDVLYHNMKHGQLATKELAEFIRER